LSQKCLPRLCKVEKEETGFGFFLLDDGGHLFTKVEANGAAAKAGVKENDEIIEVNGVNVEKASHDEVQTAISFVIQLSLHHLLCIARLLQ